MDPSLERSIGRAAALLRTLPDHASYLSLKLEPLGRGCCCFHCWPDTWQAINDEFAGETLMQDKGDILIGPSDPESRVVLECHESGPEIIIYLGVVTASLALADRVLGLLLTLLKARQHDRGKPTPHLRMTARQVKDDGSVHEERSLDIHLPITARAAEEIADYVADAIANADLPSDAIGDGEAPR